MQFIPGTWNAFGADGNGDGVKDPHNVFDASRAAGDYLCSGGANLSDPQGLVQAVLRYNHSMDYVSTVLRWMQTYSKDTVTIPDKPADHRHTGRRRQQRRQRRRAGSDPYDGLAVDHRADDGAHDGPTTVPTTVPTTPTSRRPSRRRRRPSADRLDDRRPRRADEQPRHDEPDDEADQRRR